MNENRIALLKEYIREEPDNPFNQYALAMEYYEDVPGDSLKILSDLTAKHSDYLPTYFKLAHLLWEMENWDEADNAFQKGIQLAESQNDQKALSELKSAYQNFLFENS